MINLRHEGVFQSSTLWHTLFCYHLYVSRYASILTLISPKVFRLSFQSPVRSPSGFHLFGQMVLLATLCTGQCIEKQFALLTPLWRTIQATRDRRRHQLLFATDHTSRQAFPTRIFKRRSPRYLHHHHLPRPSACGGLPYLFARVAGVQLL